MKKSTIKKWLIVILFFAFTVLITDSSKAANLSVTTSKTSVSPGESFSVTVSVSGGAGKVNITATNASISQTSLDLMLQSSATVTCTAGSSGTIAINANGVIADYSTEKDETLSAPQKNVTIVQTSDSSNSDTNGNNSGTTTTTEKSNIATLSNLGIRPNDFSGFTPSKTSYSVTVPNDVESVEVYANKGHSGQTISGTGTKKLAEGANTVNVTVTAEDGETTKTYTINITRDAKKEDDEEEEKEEQEEEETTSTTFGLKELTIDGINLQPEFQADVYEYKIELKEDLQKLDLTALATEEGANIEITGNENLQEGENIITIIVKNKDDEETIAYQIIVNKVLASEEIVENQAGQEQNTILYAVIGGVSLIIIIVIIVVIVKKCKKDDDSSMPYYNIMDNFDSDEFDDVEQEDEVEDFYEETPKKKKRSKGKRYK